MFKEITLSPGDLLLISSILILIFIIAYGFLEVRAVKYIKP